ncbi:hypothetical protein OAJ30_03905 [Alphaproteobacteria bacterium]|nr:hypothetical protein [Alphaproteobacteria bacterium]
MKIIISLCGLFISLSAQGMNVFGYSSFKCEFNWGNETKHDYIKFVVPELKQKYNPINFDDIISSYDIKSSKATVIYLSDQTGELVKNEDIIVVKNVDMLSFIEGKASGENKYQYQTLTSIFDYFVEENKFTAVRSTHQKGVHHNAIFTQEYGYCKGTKFKN